MRKHALISAVLIGTFTLGPLAGCSNLPGNSKGQGAVIGGVGGALAGAALGKGHREMGALIGGALGAGGGFLIGAQKDKVDAKRREEAIAANRRAEQNPAKAEQVDKASTADLNDDGFVTLDEVVAMERANLSDREMVDRLQRTGQVFELTEQQEKYLEDRGVSRDVVVEMREMNQPADYARTASARDARDTRDLSRDELHDPKKDQYRIRENDRPHDFQEIRQSDQAANTTESNRERF